MEKLSRREQQVADAAARGLTNRQIAAELTISTETVKRHLSTIYGKLEVPGRVVLAIQMFRSRNDSAAPPPS